MHESSIVSENINQENFRNISLSNLHLVFFQCRGMFDNLPFILKKFEKFKKTSPKIIHFRIARRRMI